MGRLACVGSCSWKASENCSVLLTCRSQRPWGKPDVAARQFKLVRRTFTYVHPIRQSTQLQERQASNSGLAPSLLSHVLNVLECGEGPDRPGSWRPVWRARTASLPLIIHQQLHFLLHHLKAQDVPARVRRAKSRLFSWLLCSCQGSRFASHSTISAFVLIILCSLFSVSLQEG